MTRTKSDRIRSKARKQLNRLLVEHQHACYWCKAELINVDTIPPEAVYRRSPTMVYWKIEEVHFSCKMATIDHLKEISEGGDNSEGNLVPSCGSCNWRRSGNPKKFAKRMAHHPYYNTTCNPSTSDVSETPVITPSILTCLTSEGVMTSSPSTTTT